MEEEEKKETTRVSEGFGPIIWGFPPPFSQSEIRCVAALSIRNHSLTKNTSQWT